MTVLDKVYFLEFKYAKSGDWTVICDDEDAPRAFVSMEELKSEAVRFDEAWGDDRLGLGSIEFRCSCFKKVSECKCWEGK